MGKQHLPTWCEGPWAWEAKRAFKVFCSKGFGVTTSLGSAKHRAWGCSEFLCWELAVGESLRCGWGDTGKGALLQKSWVPEGCAGASLAAAAAAGTFQLCFLYVLPFSARSLPPPTGSRKQEKKTQHNHTIPPVSPHLSEEL